MFRRGAVNIFVRQATSSIPLISGIITPSSRPDGRANEWGQRLSIELDTNPLRKGLPRARPVDPCVFVIFGGTGDLAERKLLPAIYQLYLSRLLPRGLAVVAYASPDMDDEAYREFARKAISKASTHVPTSGKIWDDFALMLHYVRRTDALESLKALKARLEELDRSIGIGGNYLFYMSVPPFVVPASSNGLGEVGLAHDENGGWRRIVVEKPFGEDLASARALNAELQKVWREDQIYRIDHYLGKETVQNIIVFRFTNEFVAPLLNAQYVDHIQITVAERIGIEGRGGYYDSTGALRDMVQNHLMQVMALVTMEPPSSLDAEAIRDEKVKLLRCVRPIEPGRVNDACVRGQYGPGRILGKRVPGYLEEEGVAPDSRTETFVALKLMIDNWRWNGVPVYLRTGKRLAKRASEVAIVLKEVPRVFFDGPARPSARHNVISLAIQPDEGVAVAFDAKTPGLEFKVAPVRMEFKYSQGFGESVPDAYERLILDALLGDASLYPRADAVEATWAICEPILQAWAGGDSPLRQYAPGAWGPDAATDLIARDGRKWRRP